MEGHASFVLPTKVSTPVVRAETIRRERLESEVGRALTEPAGIALLCAPAGWGKSTLAAAAASTTPGRVGWLHLDEADNDPERFLIHLHASLALHDPPTPTSGDLVLSNIEPIIRELATRDAGTVLVLDDYHAIRNAEIHEAISHLMEWMPPQLRLVISTRTDPPLRRLPRLRAAGRLVDIRAAQLAFTESETAELVALTAGELSDDALRTFTGRTEGWPAAIYLASLTMAGSDDPGGFASAFAGDNRLVADYVRAEFIDNLAPDRRSFLLRTSVLERFCPDLCDALLGSNDAAQVLRDLERSNVMLVPLDADGQWYRYHHLLADWLSDELALSGEDPAELHRRAASWHLDHDAPEAAFHHAGRAGDTALSIEVAERAWHPALRVGRLRMLAGWLEHLGETAVAGSAQLCIARGQLGLNTGAPSEEIAAWTARAEELVSPADQHLLSLLQRNAAITLRLGGDFEAAVTAARSAVAAARDDHGRNEALCLLGTSLYFAGDDREADTHLTDVQHRATLEDNALTVVLAHSYRAMIAYDRGSRRDALEIADSALSLVDGTNLQGSPIVGAAYLTKGLIALDDNDLQAAERHIDTAVELSRSAHATGMIVLSALAAARLAAARHRSLEAKRLVAEARAILAEAPAPGMLVDRVDVTGRQIMTGANPAASDIAVVEDLTDREMAVLRLLPSTLTVRQIGEELYVSPNTVKGHVKAIYRKLAVSTRDSCVATARALGIL